MDDVAVAAFEAIRRRKKRPAWVDLLDCAHPNGVRASARIWRLVCLELGVWTFAEMPPDRATLQAIVDRIKADNPPKRRRKRTVVEFNSPGSPDDFGTIGGAS